MGKQLVIKDANFSENAIEQITNVYVPQAVQEESAADAWFTPSVVFTLEDDVNELVGKTIKGFDLLFINKAEGETIGAKITFNPNGAEPIICNINCSFDTQDISEEKIVHYDLPVPYTFKNDDTLTYETVGASFSDGSGTKGGCACKRISRPDNIPNFAFLSGTSSTIFNAYTYQPFMKLYLE